jgi:hypothetical protein
MNKDYALLNLHPVYNKLVLPPGILKRAQLRHLSPSSNWTVLLHISILSYHPFLMILLSLYPVEMSAWFSYLCAGSLSNMKEAQHS